MKKPNQSKSWFTLTKRVRERQDGKRFDVIAMGELLIDFTMNGQSEQGNNLFEACPGGAPCNVLAMLNKLGKRLHFWEK